MWLDHRKLTFQDFFFFHSKANREGPGSIDAMAVDGYIQPRLVKTLEDGTDLGISLNLHWHIARTLIVWCLKNKFETSLSLSITGKKFEK